MTIDIIAIPLLQWRSGWNGGGGGMVYGQIIDKRIKGRGWKWTQCCPYIDFILLLCYSCGLTLHLVTVIWSLKRCHVSLPYTGKFLRHFIFTKLNFAKCCRATPFFMLPMWIIRENIFHKKFSDAKISQYMVL